MIPTLIHPVKIRIEPAEGGALVMDEDAREAVHGARVSTAFEIDAQMGWDSKDQADPRAAGTRETSSGYALVRTCDLQALGVTIQNGDRIVSIAGEAVDLYVTGKRPRAHYPEFGATLYRIYYADRQPARQGA